MNSVEEIRAMNLHNIKYRVFDSENKEMLDTTFDSFRNWYSMETLKLVRERGEDGEWRHLSKPMEFSTLMDKNGVELFEEDLVQATYIERLKEWPKETFEEITRETSLFKVEKHQGCFRFMDGVFSIWFHDLFLKDGRIIDSKDYLMDDSFNRRYYKFVSFIKVGDTFQDPSLIDL